jgi:hypothetical protein
MSRPSISINSRYENSSPKKKNLDDKRKSTMISDEEISGKR